MLGLVLGGGNVVIRQQNDHRLSPVMQTQLFSEFVTMFKMFLCFAGLCLLPVVGLFAWIHVAFLTIISGYELEARSFPWSVLISGVGLLFTFIAFVTLAVALCRWRSIFDDDEGSDDMGRPMTSMSEKQHGYYDNPKYGGGYNQPQKSNPYAQPYSGGQRQQYGNSQAHGGSQKYGPSMSNPAPYNSDNLYRGYQKRY